MDGIAKGATIAAVIIAVIIGAIAIGAVSTAVEESNRTDLDRKAQEAGVDAAADQLAADIRQYLATSDMRTDEKQRHMEMLDECNGKDDIAERATCLEVVASSIMWQQ